MHHTVPGHRRRTSVSSGATPDWQPSTGRRTGAVGRGAPRRAPRRPPTVGSPMLVTGIRGTARWLAPGKGRHAMGVMQRLLNIFRAKANKVLDRAEDPRDIARPLLREAAREPPEDPPQRGRGGHRQEADRDPGRPSSSSRRTSSRTRPGQALGQNREDLAREALVAPRPPSASELTDLQTQHEQIADQEQKLDRHRPAPPDPGRARSGPRRRR